MTPLASVLPLLADQAPPPESKVTPGLLGFLVVASMALALWFLLRSMTRHLRKVDFDTDPGKTDPRQTGADAETAAPPRPEAR